MNTKLKIAIAVLLLFAGLFVFTISAAPGNMIRYGRPLVVIALLAFLVYGAVTVLRNVPSFESKDPKPEGCEDEGCGCRNKQTTTTRPQAPKTTAPVSSKGK